MPTLKTRINVTLPTKFEPLLNMAAEDEGIPKSAKLLQWAQIGAELEEDYLLAQIVEKRKQESSGKFLSHEEFWGDAA